MIFLHLQHFRELSLLEGRIGIGGNIDAFGICKINGSINPHFNIFSILGLFDGF
jgi:hypothetical protein